MITYFVHSTSRDNEIGVRSGWNNCSLSDAGREQALGLGRAVAAIPFDAVYCSDLSRATETVDIAFAGRPVRVDSRLREMNYGELNGAPIDQFPEDRLWCVDNPYPGGECCLDVERRIASFLDDCLSTPETNIAIVSHQYPQLALEVLLNGYNWSQAIANDWRDLGRWQPGWHYSILEA